MKKYIKFWPIPTLILFVIINMIYTRPRTVENILMISPDTASVTVTDWTGAIPRDKKTELTKEEFKIVVEKMGVNEYRKSWGDKRSRSDSGDYFFITFECYQRKSKEHQTIILTKGGFVEINNHWYDVSEGVSIGQEMIDNIYEYIYEILEEK